MGALAVVRVLVHGYLDAGRPHFGGAEPSDLANLVRHFQGASGLDVPGAMGLLDDSFKPPLVYDGVPRLIELLGAETLTIGALSWFLAGCLALSLAAAWRLGRLLGATETAGAAAVIAVAVTPGIAGRATMVGVEPLHLALVLGALVFAVQLRRPDAAGGGWRDALLLGATGAAGLLAKWTFAVPLAAVLVTEAALAGVRGDARRTLPRLVAAGAVAAAPLLLWMALVGGPAAILGAVGAEPSTAGELRTTPGLYYFDWLLTYGVGWGGAMLIAYALAVSPVGIRNVWLLVIPAAMLGVHLAIAHKEGRYLVPMLGPPAVLVGVAATEMRAGALAIGGAVLLLGTAPQLTSPPPLEAPVRFLPDGDDRGLDAFAARFDGDARVLLVLEDERWAELRDLLIWELHARSGAVVLPARRHVSPLLPLDEATQVLVDTSEGAALLHEAGFGVPVRVPVDVPGAEAWMLYAR